MRKIIFFLLIVSLISFISKDKLVLTTLIVKGKSGCEYLIINKNKAKIDFEILRPEKNDTNILLCIAGAFTTLKDYTVDGIYVCKGKTENENKVNHSIGGAIKIINGGCEIFPTEKGKLLTDSIIADVKLKKGSLFQQIQMIKNGKAENFKDSALFYRRGIVIFKNGNVAVIESKNAITLRVFADDLVLLGVNNLLYTDMGAWDEGWYKDKTGKIIMLGYDHSQTKKQSNWVVFKK